MIARNVEANTMVDDKMQISEQSKASAASLWSRIAKALTGKVAGVQLAFYFVMLLGTSACTLLSSGSVAVIWSLVAGLAMLVVFILLWPFKTSNAEGADLAVEWIGRIVAGIAGVLSLVFSAVQLRSLLAPAVIGGRARYLLPWAAAFAILVTVLVIIGFALQMARRKRTHLIRSLSESIFGAVACTAAGGWPFFAFLTRMVADGYQSRFAMALVMVTILALVMLTAIGVAATLWWRDIRADEPGSWFGVAMLPVMFAGMVFYLLSICVFYLLF